MSETKYSTLVETLKNGILGGRYASSCPLPSEHALANRFKVSRSTVQQAFRELQKVGLISRSRGRGADDRLARLQCRRGQRHAHGRRRRLLQAAVSRAARERRRRLHVDVPLLGRCAGLCAGRRELRRLREPDGRERPPCGGCVRRASARGHPSRQGRRLVVLGRGRLCLTLDGVAFTGLTRIDFGRDESNPVRVPQTRVPVATVNGAAPDVGGWRARGLGVRGALSCARRAGAGGLSARRGGADARPRGHREVSRHARHPLPRLAGCAEGRPGERPHHAERRLGLHRAARGRAADRSGV